MCGPACCFLLLPTGKEDGGERFSCTVGEGLTGFQVVQESQSSLTRGGVWAGDERNPTAPVLEVRWFLS